jgi:hypothetical protein
MSNKNCQDPEFADIFDSFRQIMLEQVKQNNALSKAVNKEDNEHNYCEQCGDCLICDPEHSCKEFYE